MVLPAMQSIVRRRVFVCTVRDGLAMARPARVPRLLTMRVWQSRTKVNFLEGGYFGSTFISRLLSWSARDESCKCRALSLADAAFSPARLTLASLPAAVAW